MTVFTNPAGASKENARAYTQAVLQLLGERDPLEVLAEQPAWLERVLGRLGGQAIRTPEAPGKWSVLQVLWHLADSEMISRYRLRTAAAHPGAPIHGYDQDAWAKRLGYDDEDAETAVAIIRVLRPHTVRWLRSLSPAQLQLAGMHEERGSESIQHMMRLMAGHDLLHRAQIERIERAVTASVPPAV